jgi:hypothetical protein
MVNTRMHRGGLTAAASTCLLALALAASAGAGAPVGAEFQVNSFADGLQRYPDVAMESDGDFVMVWSSFGQDGFGSGVFLRRFDAAGNPLGVELQVNSYTTNAQAHPAVTMQSDGDFVVIWHSGQDGDGYGVFGQRFGSSGTPQGGEFQVNEYTTSGQIKPVVAAASDGDFVVTWQSLDQDGSGNGIFARRFSNTGSPTGTEFQVNSRTAAAQYNSAIAMGPGGDFIVTWEGADQDGSGRGVFGLRFTASGGREGAEFQVNSHTLASQYSAQVAIDDLGGFVVAWQSYGQDGGDFGIFAQRFTSAGSRLGVEFQVNAYTTFPQFGPDVAVDDDGDFVITWSSLLQDGSESGIFLRRFDSAGTPRTAELQVNSYTTSSQGSPVVAMDDGGDFVVAWEDLSQDGSDNGIFARRLIASDGAVLDIDGNAALGPLTDGLLVLRSLFSFTGATLTNGAVGPGCARCTAADIQTYLGSIAGSLDVDGNGSLGPLTDGLLVLRYLFSFTGTTLTNGAVANDCSRCDAAAIEPWLAGLVS